MASVHSEAAQQFNDMKLGKGAKPRFMLFQMKEGGVCACV
jgi:hypothetical protein